MKDTFGDSERTRTLELRQTKAVTLPPVYTAICSAFPPNSTKKSRTKRKETSFRFTRKCSKTSGGTVPCFCRSINSNWLNRRPELLFSIYPYIHIIIHVRG